jgi:hypothetical protein
MNPNPARDTLLILAPPVRLVVWLEKVFAAKQSSGEHVPEQFVKWLDRWKKIRAGIPSEIDTITIEEWAQVESILEKTNHA